jgi:hypothetical protein
MLSNFRAYAAHAPNACDRLKAELQTTTTHDTETH